MRLVLSPGGNYFSPDDPGEPGYGLRDKRLSVTDQEGEILAGWATVKRVLEIGTGLAVATRYLARTAREVVTVDTDQWVTDPEISNVRFLRDVPAESFDLAFIDGNHQYDAVMRDIARVNAPLIFMHDTYLDDVMRAIRDSGLHEVWTYATACRLSLYSK